MLLIVLLMVLHMTRLNKRCASFSPPAPYRLTRNLDSIHALASRLSHSLAP